MRKLFVMLLAVITLAGCAGPNPRDPNESFNRSMFSFNEGLDNAVLKPAVKGYEAVVPSFMRTGVANFFSNIGDVWVGINNLLQGKPDQTLSDFGRVLVNSTLGLVGFVDVASDMGLQKHNEDFGQTLGRWGVEGGSYLVLPIFGPRTVRDTFGLVFDLYANPVGHIPYVPTRNTTLGVQFFDARANIDLSLLEQAALDRYIFVRESYLQRRRNLIYDGDPPPLPKNKDDAALETLEKLAALPADAPATAGEPAVAVTALAANESVVAPELQSRGVAYPMAVPGIPDRTADKSAIPSANSNQVESAERNSPSSAKP